MVTSTGPVFAAASVTRGRRSENNAAPPSAAPAPARNRRRPTLTSPSPRFDSNTIPSSIPSSWARHFLSREGSSRAGADPYYYYFHFPVYKSGNSRRKFATLGASL